MKCEAGWWRKSGLGNNESRSKGSHALGTGDTLKRGPKLVFA